MQKITRKIMTWGNLLELIMIILVLSQFSSVLIARDTSMAVYHPDPTQYPDHIILSWSDDPTSTQSVTWRTDTSIKSAYAEIARADASPNFVYQAQRVPARTELLNFDGKSANYHSVTFKGLQSNTIYVYRVGSEKRWSEWFQFRTASKKPEPFRFIYLGDGQEDLLSVWSRAIRTAYKTAPDARFIIHGGDLVNNARAYSALNEWFVSASWINATIPIMPVIGNHEYYDGNWSTHFFMPYWRPQFTLPLNGIAELPETNYYFDFQGLRVIILNSNLELEKQAQWLEGILKNNSNQWTIVAFHHPIYCGAENRDYPKIRDTWNPIFKKYKVDLILNGHDHTYARGNNPERLPIHPDDPTGPVYVVSVSGPKLYNINKNRWMDRAAENTQLYQIITIENNTLDYKAYTVTEELYDAFQIIEKSKGHRVFVDLQSKNFPERMYNNTLNAPDD
ncbi:MAG TPA: metallophosphoesterase family protein [Candidatus Marinimicrobia bacterium]|nr:metallophosphoesterase family protein [Candidatus Neomarinimicrobiota bacterium]HRS52055.1 metallophosphoesterase family protein [Candidatus Neomarinimicrobiota bacterium]HRU93083.1 metallophosphoesterase family protein [Candidatus Neomarinimicrobiota bacterium]